MKYSIKNQLTFVFIAIMSGTILLCWFLNNGFLEKYYLRNKQQVMRRSYQNINEAISNGSIQSEEFENQLQRLC